MPSPAAKQLATVVQEIDANLNRAIALTGPLSGNQFNWCPAPGRWSVGQNLAHLIRINGPDVNSLQKAIAAGRDQAMTGAGPFRYGLFARMSISSMEPPVKRKFKAPAYFEPPPTLEKEPTLAEYRRITEELKRLAADAEGLHLDCVKVEMSAFPPLVRAIIKMPLGARFELLAAHDRRHLVQAEAVRDEAGFPKQ